MDSILPIKSSSRAGRFKKKLVSESELVSEAPLIMAKFRELSPTEFKSVDFVAAYIIIYLSHRYPGTWLGAKKQIVKIPGPLLSSLPVSFEENILKRLNGLETLYDVIASFALRSTPLAVNRAILGWKEGSYLLEHMNRIPSPKEVLAQQKMGHRCVTTILDARLGTYILGERDALSFTMHDLIHADHFYFHNNCYQGQLGFYGLLAQTIEYFDLTHEKFASEFEYLISDMNAYAIHLLKCLKSAMVHYYDEEYFRNWPKDLGPPESLFLLNTKDYHPESMDHLILGWLDTFREAPLSIVVHG